MSNHTPELTDNPQVFEQAGQLSELTTQWRRVLEVIMNTESKQDSVNFSLDLSELFAKALAGNVIQPDKLLEANTVAFDQYSKLFGYVWSKSLGTNAEPVIETEVGDPRFRSNHWSENLWFDTLKQSYLIGSEYFHSICQSTDHLSEKEAKKVEFFTRQFTDALAPTNIAMLNPEVIQQAVKTNGQSIIDGMKNLADDLEAGTGVKMVDRSEFKLGVDIASTPGKVIARNELAELIQYSPTTEQVYEKPILIIPPWINKYYILDLKKKNSYIGWLVEQGFTVFVISWINPDGSYREIEFEDYLKVGPLWALEEIEAATGSREVNAIGYCLGGTLLSILLAYLAAHEQKRIASATFFTSMIDFGEPGDLGVFVDDSSVSQLESMMQKTGYLDGKSMASTFNMMRANDLIWHFVVNNYLLGKSPGSFDLLYWNSDSTRMPAKMHSWYLKNMYVENNLCKPNGITLLDTPIDLSLVKTPCYFLSTELDHISPWKSTYTGAKLLKGSVKFVLGESGHIAGVINPPAKNKYGYYTTRRRLPATPDRWLETATYQAGSWWPHWNKWVSAHSGSKVEARQPEKNAKPPLCDAPGTYVLM